MYISFNLWSKLGKWFLVVAAGKGHKEAKVLWNNCPISRLWSSKRCLKSAELNWSERYVCSLCLKTFSTIRAKKVMTEEVRCLIEGLCQWEFFVSSKNIIRAKRTKKNVDNRGWRSNLYIFFSAAGVDEDVIIAILVKRNNEQRQKIKVVYEGKFGEVCKKKVLHHAPEICQ